MRKSFNDIFQFNLLDTVAFGEVSLFSPDATAFSGFDIAGVDLSVIAENGPSPEITTLNPGDVAVIGMQQDAPDAFSVVFLTDVDAGTQVGFTERSWDNGAFVGT